MIIKNLKSFEYLTLQKMHLKDKLKSWQNRKMV